MRRLHSDSRRPTRLRPLIAALPLPLRTRARLLRWFRRRGYLNLVLLPLDLFHLHVDVVIMNYQALSRRVRGKNVHCSLCTHPANMGKEIRTIFHANRYQNFHVFQRLCPCARPSDRSHPDGAWCVLERSNERNHRTLPALLGMLVCGWALLLGGSALAAMRMEQIRSHPLVARMVPAKVRAPFTPTPPVEVTNVANSEQARRALERGRSLLERGEFDRARIELLNARKQNPKEVDVHLALARCHLALGNGNVAYQNYSRALELEEHNWEARLGMVDLLIASGHLDQAEETLAKVPYNANKPEGALGRRHALLQASLHVHAGRMPEALPLMRQLAADQELNKELIEATGQLALNAGRLQLAETCYRRLIDELPNDAAGHVGLAATLRLQGFKAEAVRALREAETLDPQSPDVRVQRAEMMLLDGDPAIAMARYRTLADELPDHGGIKSRLASLLLAQGLEDEALTLAEDLTSERKYEDAAPAGHFMQAELYRRKGFYSKAIRHAREAVTGAPQVAQYHFVLGQALQAQGKHQEAIASFNAAISRAPELIAASIQRARSHMALGQFDVAEAQLREAAAAHPASPLLRLELGNMLYFNGAYEKAQPELEKVLELTPGNTMAANNLAFILADRGDNLDRALALAQMLYDDNPGDPNAADLMGWVKVQRGEVEEGLKLLQFAARYITDNPYMHYHLGVAWLRQGDADRGRIELERALAFPGRFAASEKAQSLLNGLEQP